METDLGEDAKEILTYIARRVEKLDVASNEGSGEGDRVHQINSGHSTDQSSFFTLVLDTREDANTDAEWTAHLGGNTMLEMDHWSDTTELMEDEPVTIVDAKEFEDDFEEVPAEAHIAELFGSILLNVMPVANRHRTPKRCKSECWREALNVQAHETTHPIVRLDINTVCHCVV